MHAKGSAKHKPANGKGASPQQRKPPAKATASSAATPDASTPADKKAAKQAKLERKKPVLALVKKVVALWDEMRPSQVGAERKREISAQIVTAGKGHLKELALNHASARQPQARFGKGPIAGSRESEDLPLSALPSSLRDTERTPSPTDRQVVRGVGFVEHVAYGGLDEPSCVRSGPISDRLP